MVAIFLPKVDGHPWKQHDRKGGWALRVLFENYRARAWRALAFVLLSPEVPPLRPQVVHVLVRRMEQKWISSSFLGLAAFPSIRRP